MAQALRRVSRLLPVCALFACAATAHGASRADCLSFHSEILGRAAPYCIILPPSYDADASRRYPVLYFLHGIGENEQMLLRAGGLNLIEDMWDRRDIGEFLIVTPGADSSFYINSHDGRVRYEDFFLRELLPYVEKRYRAKSGRAARAIGGISMGGYGALHLAFAHPELFSAVSAHSAALIARLPRFEPAPGAAQPQETPRMRLLGTVFGSPLDRKFWERNDPLALARTADLRGLKIYFDCGSEDDYGFNAGAAELDTILDARRVPHEFHSYPGAHDWVYFAEHLPASLEFHSRAFGLPPSDSDKIKPR
jgi:S-formylglutathione hydrolase FrmB